MAYQIVARPMTWSDHRGHDLMADTEGEAGGHAP